MNRTRCTAIILGWAILSAWSSSAFADGPIAWTSDYEAAKVRAQAEGKLILVNIHASWCIPCKRLQAGTLMDPTLGAEVSKYCVAVSLDADINEAIIRQWPITGFPTQLFCAPSGAVVHSIVGNVNVETYLTALHQAVGLAGIGSATPPVTGAAPPAHVVSREIAPAPVRPAVANPAPTPPPMHRDAAGLMAQGPPPVPPQADVPPPASAPPAAPPANVPPPMVASQNPIGAPSEVPSADPAVATAQPQQPLKVALGGYCPVSMLQRAELLRGTETQSCVFKDKKYLFVSSVEREAFLSDPKKFLPSEDGLCVVTWAEQHRRSSGSVDFPALYGDYLFLFSSDDSRQKFLRDPERYVDGQGRAHRIPLHSFRGERTNVR